MPKSTPVQVVDTTAIETEVEMPDSEKDLSAEEEITFSVVLDSISAVVNDRINAIKEVRMATGLSIKESQEIINQAQTGESPVVVTGFEKTEADKIVRRLEIVGAKARAVQNSKSCPKFESGILLF